MQRRFLPRQWSCRAGARETLKTVKTVLIEIYDGTDEEKRILPMMQELGLREESLGEGRFRNRLFVR